MRGFKQIGDRVPYRHAATPFRRADGSGAAASQAQAPSAPTNLRWTTTTSTQIRLDWTDNSSNVDGFVVQYLNSSNTWQTIGTLSSNTTAVLVNMPAGYTFYFRIVAFNSNGQSASASELGSSRVTVCRWSQTAASL